MPRLDLMLNNIVAYPTAIGHCGARTALCFLSPNGDAVQPIEKIIHQADSSRGIPRTRMDGNVYANATGSVIVTEDGSYSSETAWSAAAAAAPISILGLDANSRAGDTLVDAQGSPTLLLHHGSAIPVPVDPELNQYLPAGTKHYGCLRSPDP